MDVPVDHRGGSPYETMPAPSPRIVGFDVARCLAILSMVFVNFEVLLAFGQREPGWLAVVAEMFEGNASALFVTLAGCGVVILGRRGVILRRALLLLVVGYLWQVIWPGDILHYYAFYLTFGALCLGLSARWLWLFVAAAIAGFVVLFRLFDYGEGWHWQRLSYTDFWTPAGQLRNLVFNGWHPLLPWLAFLFSGMALARWRVQERGRRRLAMIVSAVVYVASWLLSRELAGLPDESPLAEQWTRFYAAPKAFWAMSSLPPGPLYMLSAGAAAVFVIALCLELTSEERMARLVKPLSRTGELALSFYLAHVLALYFAVYPFAEDVGMPKLTYAGVAAVGFCAGAILFANLWPGRRGPLEWAMRRLCG